MCNDYNELKESYTPPTQPNALKVNVQLTKTLQNDYINILPKNVDITIPIREGYSTIVTDPIYVGHLKYIGNPELYARFTFGVRYVPGVSFSIFGPDADSEHKMTVDILQRGKKWPYNTPVTSGLPADIAAAEKAAVNAIIQEAKDKLGITIHHYCQTPELPAEVYAGCNVVYKNGRFAGWYNPDFPMGPEYEVVGIKSTIRGVSYLAGNFCNVIGSTGDTNQYSMSWIMAWTYVTKLNLQLKKSCGSYQYQNFDCTEGVVNIIGGHVISGTASYEVPYGVDGIVNVFPICKHHNASDNTLMYPVNYGGEAIMLDGYHVDP